MKKDNKQPVIYWLGGSTCAGKTTISNRLSVDCGFLVYHCDEHLGEHTGKSDAIKHPNLHKGGEMDWNYILSMKTEEYLNWIVGVFKEEFEMILEDLYNLPNDKPILAEGINLLPQLVHKEIKNSNEAVFVVAGEKFYKEKQMLRPELFERLRECKNPDQALQNYMNYDLAFGRYIVEEAKELDMKVLITDKESNIKKNVETILSLWTL